MGEEEIVSVTHQGQQLRTLEQVWAVALIELLTFLWEPPATLPRGWEQVLSPQFHPAAVWVLAGCLRSYQGCGSCQSIIKSQASAGLNDSRGGHSAK